MNANLYRSFLFATLMAASSAIGKAVVVDTSRSPHARIGPVPVSMVELKDSFWSPRIRANRDAAIPAQYRQLEETGRLDNFRRAAGAKRVDFQGIFFNDSDVYKWVEAASWALAANEDSRLNRILEMVVDTIAAAQQEDGYLNTYFMFERAKERWSNLRDMHELYCAGHLMQAAIAHHRVTGSDKLLDVARRFADNIGSVFCPGKRVGAPGHEEIEMGLVELFRETGEKRYLELARFFIDSRGKKAAGGQEYCQDHRMFTEQDAAVGHAVRAVYLYAGASDVLAETGDETYGAALEKLWRNVTERRMYVTGGIGSRYAGEAFGKDYELPNARAYSETCAAIGSIMWNWRQFLLAGDARYVDLVELALFNAVLPGVSLDGKKYFYQNPLADDGTHRRQDWFHCACCPPNVARLLASLTGYFYGVSERGIWVNLYASGTAFLTMKDGSTIQLNQKTDYPWDGKISIEVEGEGDFALFLRVPGWCQKGASLAVNGGPGKRKVRPGSYAEIRRNWRRGDRIDLFLPMPVRRVRSHPHLFENTGRIALARGPLVYCLEAADNARVDLRDLEIADDAGIRRVHEPKLLGGVTVLRGLAAIHPPSREWDGRLYGESMIRSKRPKDGKTKFTAVPYYAWANRDPGPMLVWVKARR